MIKIESITDANFAEKVLKSELPVLVDFWAPWCGPCKMLAPLLEDLAKEYEHKLLIYKIDVSDNKQHLAELSIKGIPALFLFHKGDKLASKSGLMSYEELKAFINENV